MEVSVDQYELYCLAKSPFYDRLDEKTTEATDYALVKQPMPKGWRRTESDTWIYCGIPDDPTLPAQGWKIHLSVRIADAERALAILWDYCTTQGVAFKFLRGEPIILASNSKSASRGASGKFATIYPRDENELRRILECLDEELKGVEGPYILSDLRYADGPLYVRYGGFAERRCVAANGDLVPAVQDGEGRLVPDVRGSVFSVPPWTTLPAFLEPHLARRNAVTVSELAYEIVDVLHFSNGGGVYLGTDKADGRRVVLKEGRPHAGLDAAGRDAQERLRHERDILRRLSGLDTVPELIDYFRLGDHEFLVEEFVDGNPLQRKLVQRFPLTRADCSASDLDEYTEWAVDLLDRVDAAVSGLHERGVVFGDLHPENILITADGRLVLIDFEVATFVEDDVRSNLAHPAFVPPWDRTGVNVDGYALACLTLGLFAPQATIMLPLHRGHVDRLAALVYEVFPVGRERITRAVQTITGPGTKPAQLTSNPPLPGLASWSAVRDAMHKAILASATPERQDRLFPGDVSQFRPGGGFALAHGAAGVLLALHESGAQPPADFVDILAKRAVDPEQGSGLGFYDGLHGMAYTLDRLGNRQSALDVIDIWQRERWEALGLDLFSGLAGIGLNLLNLGHEFADTAQRVIDICADRLGGPDDVTEISGGDNPRAGLMHGSSGPALLFLHAYERTGDKSLLDKAADALRQDLRRCTRAQDGSLQVNQDWRYLPYLAEGSAGIGLVLARYLRHRPDDELAQALADLRRVAESKYFVQSGLFMGRAGIIAALAMGLRSDDPGPDPLLVDQILGLRWHALPYAEGLAFPGDQLLRLSMDLATGTAGVLYALAAAQKDGAAYLPFFEPPGNTRSRRLDHDETRKEV